MGTTAEKLQAILGAKADIKDAIEAKGVTVGDATLAEYASKIGDIQQVGGEEEDYHGDVIFVDYDGTVVYRYTKSEFLALEEMPANPVKAGFTAQGWNWTLADAKTYVTECGMLVIGQMRVTSDDKTHIYITLDDPDYLSPSIILEKNKQVDWGDGTTDSTGNAGATLTHTYSTTGSFVITTTSNGARITSTVASNKLTYLKAVRKIHFGSLTAFLTYHYQDYLNLEEVNIPMGVTSFTSGGGFDRCISLKATVLPSTVTAIGNYTFRNCSALRVVSINKNCTFGNDDFGSCYSLILLCFPYITSVPAINYESKIKRVVMPSTVTTIASSCFQRCFNLEHLKLSNNITTMNGYSIDYCFSLSSLILPSELTTLKTRALQGCYLVSITVPSKVTSIETLAFYSCAYLKTIHMLPTTPPTAGANMFLDSTIEKIYVPQGSLSAYQTATNWSAYASYMEEEPTT